MPKPIVTLSTDFGGSSHYQGIMRGVMLSINPDIKIVDITHDIPPFDTTFGTYLLETLIENFPSPTIHLMVVDPGVGSERDPLIAVGEKHYYIVPDNGLLTRIIKSDKISRVVAVDGEHYRRSSSCETFHGRDIFAPVAAYLTKALNVDRFGTVTEDYVKLDLAKPSIVKDRTIQFKILSTDHFGNLITNMDRTMFKQAREKFAGNSLKIKVGNTLMDTLSTHYHAVAKTGDPLAYFGSMNLLEIAVREGNAQQILGAKIGDPVAIYFGA